MHDDGADRTVTHVPPGEGSSFWLATNLHVFKAAGEGTGGAFSLTELTVQPQLGPPPHVHHREAESFYVLEGVFEFLDGDRAFTAGAGSFVHLPKGHLHAHLAAGDAPAGALGLITPAGVEKFIEEASEPATGDTSFPPPPEMPELERIAAVAQRYGAKVPLPDEQ